MIPETSPSFYPLSLGQQALWFLYQMTPESVAYNIFDTALIRSSIDITALHQAWQKIVNRHPILRTIYTTYEGKPFQIIQEQIEIYIHVTDASNWSEDYLKKQILLETDLPFNLEKELPWRLNVFTLSPQEHILLLTMHHIASDSWSNDLLFTELQLWYEAETQQLRHQQIENILPENLPYIDFVNWQSKMLSTPKAEKYWEYWKKELSGELPILNLPTDRPRPPIQNFSGGTKIFQLDEKLIKRLRELTRDRGTSLYKLMLTIFFVLLYRYTNQEDILVGSPMLGRPGRDFRGIVGYFVNPAVLRASISGSLTFPDLLAQVSTKVKTAQKYQNYPFPLLVEQLQPQRDSSCSPLFQVSFTWQKQRWCKSGKELGLKMEPYPLGHQRGASFDLDVMIMEMGEILLTGWQYNTDLFNVDTIVRMAGDYNTLLEAIALNPEQRIAELSLLTPAMRHKLLVDWNNTRAEYPQDKCIHHLFEEQVRLTPDAIAIVFEGKQLTYQDLNAKANQLAHYLQTLGVKPEILVGICVERSLEMIIGLLGILKAGGAYVPLDPAYPKERLAFMLEDSSVPVLITQQKLVEKLPRHSAHIVYLDSNWEEISFHSQENSSSEVNPENLVYVIYTSGSTGKPKGVLIEHSSLVNYITNVITEYQIEKSDCILQFSSISFDVSAEEIYTSLVSGAKLVLRTDTMLDSFEEFLQNCKNWKITVLALPTAYWHELTVFLSQKTLTLPPLRLIILGGEKALRERLKTWFECVGQQIRLLNNYGPTEATIGATIYELSTDDTLLRELPIGRPLRNVYTYILDQNQQPVTIGVPGELYIGGIGLARGYLNRPELNSERFIHNPFSDSSTQRLYKTGDQVRYLPDGNIEYLSRIDDQVKVRGFRIELGEIETLLAQHPDVIEGVVICREDNPGEQKIVAYITCNLIPDRIAYHSECQLELDSNVIKCHTEDISTGGVAVVGLPAVNIDKFCRLHLQLPGEKAPQWLYGKVVWSHPPKAGVSFHLTPSEQIQVEKSIAYQLESKDWWKTFQRTITRNLRNYLKQKLPSYMIPSAFVLMKALPLTPNGKIDRRALPIRHNVHNEQEDKILTPVTPTETKMATIWAEVLGLKRVGINDNFFELGGHSLLATQIISRIGQVFAIKLPLRHLFEAPTIFSLCKVLEDEYNISLQELSDCSIVSENLPNIFPAKREGHLPLSIQQKYIWHVQQLNPHSCACNSGIALRLTFQVSSEILEKSINEIICRHESLRTSFPVVEGQPIQVITPDLTIPLKIVDLQNLPLAKRETEAFHFSKREMNYHFDLANGPLIKTTLVRLSSEEHWLLIVIHHIITDGWSIAIFVQELEMLYHAFSNNLPSPLPELPLQYADFTLWQRQHFNEEVLARQLNYWVQKLAVPLQQTQYQLDQESRLNLNSDHASSYSLTLREDLVIALEDLSRSQNVTTSTILLATLTLLLFKYQGNNEILIVTTIGNRSTPELETMLGCFINDVILRVQIDDEQTGVTLLDQVQKTLNEAIGNKEIPLQQVIEVVKRQRKLKFSASVTIVPPVQSSDQMSISELVLDLHKGTLWDEEIPLELYISWVSEKSKVIKIYACYGRDLFTHQTIKGLFSYYQEILHNFTLLPQMKIGKFERFQEKFEKMPK